jgi:hypothetical protein
VRGGRCKNCAFNEDHDNHKGALIGSTQQANDVELAALAQERAAQEAHDAELVAAIEPVGVLGAQERAAHDFSEEGVPPLMGVPPAEQPPGAVPPAQQPPGAWRPEEDAELHRLVEQMGVNDWDNMAKVFSVDRTAGGLSNRWYGHGRLVHVPPAQQPVPDPNIDPSGGPCPTNVTCKKNSGLSCCGGRPKD